ncbi:MAG: tRNA (cytidine(56)-2'-O)-methyltransferase [Nitrososphaerota archaeon]|jgi:tRNA (cytidine56-2'-O)-methyltransferase|nr:tRNA (cytidine(56)-2'-O)-methyltransferase [Nitrososphaerota archaeon]
MKERSNRQRLPFEVTVLRLGHRLVRDERISTHIGLVSRAFGAKELILTGADDRTIDSISRVNNRWGESLSLKYQRNWREIVSGWKGVIVHLTMYGEALDDALPRIEKATGAKGKLLVVVGAEKVPREIYDLASYNVSVGNQPHSEVAALAVFLDRLFMGEELYTTFVKARIRIKPSSNGKKVETQ